MHFARLVNFYSTSLSFAWGLFYLSNVTVHKIALMWKTLNNVSNLNAINKLGSKTKLWFPVFLLNCKRGTELPLFVWTTVHANISTWGPALFYLNIWNGFCWFCRARQIYERGKILFLLLYLLSFIAWVTVCNCWQDPLYGFQFLDFGLVLTLLWVLHVAAISISDVATWSVLCTNMVKISLFTISGSMSQL